ncbi:hypothetical protein JEG43_13680, partial [Anoxybacillus sp. LAT_35]|uniref:hypothetical protein n=1 Tax=unclassified Anoxybacillus TaxID=2639704 RepID=UPI001EEBA806
WTLPIKLSTVNTACCIVNMRFTSLSINIHIMDKKYKKYSAHFMMWLNSYEQRRLARPPDVKIIHLFTSDRMSQGRMCSLRFFVPSAERFCPTDFLLKGGE